jgi:hypothetical protein
MSFLSNQAYYIPQIKVGWEYTLSPSFRASSSSSSMFVCIRVCTRYEEHKKDSWSSFPKILYVCVVQKLITARV